VEMNEALAHGRRDYSPTLTSTQEARGRVSSHQATER